VAELVPAGTSRVMPRWWAAVSERRNRVLLLGAVFWALMLWRIVSEGGRFTRDALPVGWDFHIFRSAGALVASGRAASLYDPAALERAAKASLPGDYPVFPYLNPPHFAAAFAPLSALPYPVALGLVTVLGLALLLGALKILLRETARPASAWLACAYALASYPVIVGLLAGQSCFLSQALLAGAAVAALHGRPFWSGLLVGALAYKPQLTFGFLVLFALERSLRWRALAGFASSGALSLVACVLVSAQASREYVLSLGELADVQARFRLALSVTGRAFFEQLLPSSPGLARGLGAALALGCVGAYCVWAKRERRLKVLLAGAVWLTLAAAPHASVYEWTLLLVPLSLLHGELDEQKFTLVAAIPFLVSYLAPPLAEAMGDALGFALHLAVPALVGTGWYAARALAPPSNQRSPSNRFT
jgi:alpha-1,2-mannosyltransferase